MPNTPNGLPYPAATATPDVPRDLLALATALDDNHRIRCRRALQNPSVSIADATNVTLSGGFVAIANAGDAGNGKGIDYTVGKIKATRDIWVALSASCSFTANATGSSRWLEVTGAPAGTFRAMSPASGVTCGVVLALPSLFLPINTELTMTVWQNSGAAMTVNNLRWLVTELEP